MKNLYSKWNKGTNFVYNHLNGKITMYDKVGLWLNSVLGNEQQGTVAQHLDDVTTQISHDTGEVKTFGRLGGLNVSVYAGGLSIVGSLPKYLYGGSNVYPLDRHTTADVVAKISDALHLDIGDADVRSIEFGTIFMMMHKVSDYLDRLGDMPRLNRCRATATSLYYTGRGRRQFKVFNIYDKTAEAKAKGMPIPSMLEGANLLRYEMRLNGKLGQQLKEPPVKASTLYRLPFYSKVMRLYQDSYYSIQKLNQVKTNVMSDIETVGDAYNVFVARLMSKNPEEAADFLNDLKRADVFKDRISYTRLKNKLKAVAAKADISNVDELVKELDNDIQNCGVYV